MRIVLDARYLGPKTSGIGTYVRAVAKRLPKLDPDLDLRLWLPENGQLDADLAQRVSSRHLSAVPNGLATLCLSRWFDDWTEVDLFHAPANVLGFGIPVPAVVTLHDVMWLEHLAWCQPIALARPVSFAYFQTAIRHAIRKARRILTVSRASRDAIIRIEPRAHSRIVVAHNAHEPDFCPPSSRAQARANAANRLGFEEDYVLMVGQNVPSKGHDIGLRAFAAHVPRPLRLVVIQRLAPGQGLAALAAALGVTDRVSFAPELPFDAFLDVLRSARLLLQPSRAEGFGLPVLEAMAAGCPVLASDIEPLVEVLGNAGVTVPVGDVRATGEALASMLTDRAHCESLRAAGLERSKDFSWDDTAKVTLETYRDAVRAG
jgi:glycosyltransferase involved in cell wall biosynthesis